MYYFIFLEVKGLFLCLCYWNKSATDIFTEVISTSDIIVGPSTIICYIPSNYFLFIFSESFEMKELEIFLINNYFISPKPDSLIDGWTCYCDLDGQEKFMTGVSTKVAFKISTDETAWPYLALRQVHVSPSDVFTLYLPLWACP